MNNTMYRIISGLLALLTLLTVMSNVKAETVTYYFNDLSGSPVAAMDSSGNRIWRESYQPFGEKRVKPSASNNDIGYTGHQNDDFIGLTYMQARYYDSTLGRFYGIDPVPYTEKNPVQSFNPYLYGNNNPYKFTDPFGKFIELVVKRFEDYAAEAMGFEGVNEANSFVGNKTNQIMKPVDYAVKAGNKKLLSVGMKALAKGVGVVQRLPSSRVEFRQAGDQLSVTLLGLSVTPCSAYCAGGAAAIDGLLALDNAINGEYAEAGLTLLPGFFGEAAERTVKTMKGANSMSKEVGVVTELSAQGSLKATEVMEEEQ